MIIGDPYKIAFWIDIVPKWNDDDSTWINGIFSFCINGKIYPCVDTSTLNSDLSALLNAWHSCSMPCDNESLFHASKIDALRYLLKITYPTIGEQTCKYKLSTQTIEDNDVYLFILIESQKKDWEIATNSFINKLPYQYTQEIIILAKSDKQAAILALKKYLTKYWYRGHNNESWYNLHKKDINSYYGYWSFESGALVKILGLDDSSLKEVQYYPYDMVHWNENN